MMGNSQVFPTLEGSTLVVLGSRQSNQQDSRQQRRERPRCDYCGKLGHTKGTCWKVYWRPVDWKPADKKHAGKAYDKSSQVNTAKMTERINISS